MESIIKIQNLHYKVDEKFLLRDISLDIHAGETFAILGSNGAGKSTLINIIYDYTILNSINDSGFSDDNLDSIFNMDYIYKKYDIDSVKLIESQKFYTNIKTIPYMHTILF